MFTLNQLTIEKSKLVPYALAILATAAVVYQAVKKPEVYEKTRVKVVTKTVDRIVYRDRVRKVKEVITKPDGTKIDRETIDEDKSKSKTRDKTKTTDKLTVISHRLPNYSLSIHCDVRSCSSYSSYQVLGGFRLGQLPLNLEVGGGFNGILVGVRYDF